MKRKYQNNYERGWFDTNDQTKNAFKSMAAVDWDDGISAFIFNTSEFMPIGLLSDIAANFGITESHAGLLISVYSWVVTLLSLPLMLLVSKMSYRKLLLGTIALFGIFQVLSGVSASYGMLMVSRIGVACTHAIFWSVASPIAVRLVPGGAPNACHEYDCYRNIGCYDFRAAAGQSHRVNRWLANDLFMCGSRCIFGAVLSAVCISEDCPTEHRTSRRLPQILKRRQLLGIYLITFLVASAYYTGYSYIEPFLKQVAHLADSWITIVLTLFGAAGLLGSFLFSRLYDRHRYAFIRFIIASVAVALLCLRVASISLYLVILVCVLWGMAVTAFNVAFQAETIKAVPEEASAVAMSLFSGIFNLGIGCGTWLGGTVCNQLSIANIGYAGGIIGVLAVLYCVFRMIPLWKAKQKN